MRRITHFPKLNNRSEFSWDDRMNIKLGLGVAAKRNFNENAPNPIGNLSVLGPFSNSDGDVTRTGTLLTKYTNRNIKGY